MSITAQVTGPPYPPIGLLKGMLVGLHRTAPTPANTYQVPFQYNPDQLKRTLKPSYYEASRDRFTGPATQSIDVTVQLEASRSAEAAQGVGVLPYLAALELMIYPDSTELDTYVQDTRSNKMKAVPPLAPRCLFIWGPSRVLPVRLSTVTVTEQLFNLQLTPEVASVALSMEIYPFEEADEPDYQLLLTNLKTQEKQRAELPQTGADPGVKITSTM